MRAIWSGNDVGDSAAASASCSLLSMWSNGIAIEGLTDTVGMRPVYLKLKSQEVLPGQVPICGVRGEVLACTLHGRLYWLLLCRPAPEFVIAVRVVHGVPMIWSDRGNRQTNQKMVWLGVITGFQDSGSIPIRSFTAPRSRCLQPRYFSVVCTDTCPSRN